MADPNQSGDHRHLAIFRVASYIFCAPAHTIFAITSLPAWTRIPKTPPSILGAINHRGQVVVVVSLRNKLGLEPMPPSERGQLIIAELNVGLTGFMVDEVEDVRLPVDMQRHPLATDAAIDIFDAYLVTGQRILLQTTFQKLYDARETPPLETTLLTNLQQAEEQQRTRKASAPAPEAIPAAATPGALATPGGPPRSPILPAPTNDSARDDAPRPAPQQEAATAPPAAEDITRPPEKPPAAWRRYASAAVGTDARQRVSGPSTYRYAIVAALLLMLTVTLGAGLWLARQQAGLRSEIPGSKAPRAETPRGDESATGQAEVPNMRPAETPARDEATGETAAVEPPSAPAARVAVTATGERAAAVAAENPESFPPEARKSEPPPATPATEANARPPGEVLRVETEAFTLTVERPGDTATARPDPAEEAPPGLATEEFRHIVVPGDTLWDIAAHYLGDPFQYTELARLSRIRDPDLIYPNDVIRIVRRTAGNQSTPP
jgi:purine-binding chemotaxis protein CheW